MSDAMWLALGFGIVWAAIGLYIVRIAIAQRSIERRLESMRDAARAKSPPPGGN